MTLNILETLCHPAFAGSSITGGWAGLGREVKAITVAEVPDAAQWLKGGEVVLSTGYFFRDEAQMFADWFTGLAEAGCVCVGIKPQRFMQGIPASVINQANRLGVPLVALPNNVVWPQLITPVTERLILSEAGDRTYIEEFVTLLGSGGGFPRVAQMLAEMLDNPIVIEDVAGTILGSGTASVPPGTQDLIDHLVSRGGYRSVAAHGYDGRDGSAFPVPPRQLLNIPINDNSDSSGHPVLQTTSLWCAGRHRGSLTMVAINAVPPAINAGRVLHFAAAALSLCFDHLSQAWERPRSVRQARLLSALQGTDKSGDEGQGEWDELLSDSGVITVVRFTTQQRAELPASEIPMDVTPGLMDRLILKLEIWARTTDQMATAFPFDESIGLLLHASKTQLEDPLFRQKLLGVERTFRSEPEIDQVLVGVSPVCQGEGEFRRGFSQAQQALSLAGTNLGDTGTGNVSFYDQLGIFRVFGDVMVRQDAIGHGTDLLSPLLALEGGKGTYLLETLREYLNANGQLLDASKRLHLHHNTLRYRLRQVESLTGLSLQRLPDLVQLYLAVQLLGVRNR